ncbi:Pre-mRNA-splicing factor ISY1 -like protein [Capsicum baccatum]|uniref:Pre-mRNA-splicing factor ISY1-like protein n=1 Tax=Capsicum baccatum TaxID=33114 RepID=A0A2G2VKD2_CAPBA|nr:Pre-mRNA-splicing factor ISY1 -like protein [Capsicum baccatum]
MLHEMPLAIQIWLYECCSDVPCNVASKVIFKNIEPTQKEISTFQIPKKVVPRDKKPKQQPLRRPYLASQCRDLPKADIWRQQVMQEIGRKVLEIQNEGLGEHCLRDMNDEINKLIREKSHWEKRIVEVSGPNYMKHNIVGSSKSDGRGPGYIYIGATKKLPAQEEEESGEEFVVHVSLPDEKEIERMVVQRKMELLKRYVSEDLMEEQREV